MENRAPATPGVRKPHARPQRGAGVWVVLGVVGVVLAGGAWWLGQEADPAPPSAALVTTAPISEPPPAEALPAESDHARVLSAAPAETLTGTADVAPRGSAPAKIIDPESDNPFAVIDKSATPAPVKPAGAKATPPADPFAVVAKATPAPAPAAAARTDDNPFASATTPRAAATEATPPAPTPAAKPKPAAPPTPMASKPQAAAKAPPPSAAKATPSAGTDLLSQLQRNIETANQAEAAPAASAKEQEKASAAKPLQRKSNGTDAEVLDDLVEQVNGGRKAVETISGTAASDLLKKK